VLLLRAWGLLKKPTKITCRLKELKVIFGIIFKNHSGICEHPHGNLVAGNLITPRNNFSFEELNPGMIDIGGIKNQT
jgi:hypothetical protein